MDRALGRSIRERRVALSLTQEEAALRAGISPTTWRNLELGRQAARQLTLAAVARALELPDLDALRTATDIGVVRRIAEVLEEQPTVDAALSTFHALCTELLPEADVAAVTYLVRHDNEIETVAAYGSEGGRPPVINASIDDEPLLRRILQDGQSVTLDLERESLPGVAVRRQLHDAGVRSLLGLPTRTGGRITGVLALSSRRRHAFQGVDIPTLEAAGRVVMHVLNSLLVFTATSEPGSGATQRTDILRLAARLTSLDARDRALIESLVDRMVSDRPGAVV